MRRRFWPLCMVAFVTASPLSAQKEEDKVGLTLAKPKPENSVLPADLYAYVELRHHLNSYYDQKNVRTKQEPTLHARAKIGSTFNNGVIDAFATLGVIKGSETQQVVQRRPEIEADIYLFSGKYGQIVQYNIARLPFSDAKYDSENDDASKQGTIYMIGIAPTLVLPIDIYGSSLKLKSGFDYWTELYSRKQMRSNRREREDDHFAATDSEESTSEENGKEDTALKLFSEYTAGYSVTPAFSRALTLEALAFYDSDFLPKYKVNEEGEEEQTYSAKRTSHYRIRLQYDANEKWTLMNDFYHFYDGFFKSQTVGDVDRRFRNIMRVSYRF